MATNDATQKEELLEFFSGTFFASTSSVLKVASKTTSPERWTDLHRTSSAVRVNVRRKNRSAKNLDPYTVTRNAIEQPNDGVASSGLTTTTDSDDKSVSAKQGIWGSDMFGRKKFNPKLAQIAHIIPAGKLEHEEWFGVAAAMIGLDENTSTKKKLMAIRGTNELPNTSEEGKEKGKPERVRNSGIVHSVSNKLRLEGQGGIVDGSQPSMLIIPAMTLDDAKAWSGQGYIAAVLIGLPESDGPLGYLLDEEMETLVYGSVGLKDRKLFEQLKNRTGAILTVPKVEEHILIQKACQALTSTLLGLAQYV